ncbi:MAG: glutamine--fructose-6-phosphate transaminase (isomerizing) [Holosporales bacterium]|jgi:glucosamine--fructose-6-phosphate aminotransferase (isomerizing)|nr:glutamine--fructose-6-phosphate transaminase (isomerizing) [Holosporales bacterium]
MCGIVSVLSRNDGIIRDLIDCLSRLEYRGYDSAGIAYVDKNSRLCVKKTIGKIASLEKIIDFNEGARCRIGIGHTRWATHGEVTIQNAHPHTSDEVAIVHNGIIENYESLKESLMKDGFVFDGVSDSEVVAKLISYHLKKNNDFLKAFQATIGQLKGAFAIVAIHADYPYMLLGAKRGSPMAVGLSPDSQRFYIASDAVALSSLCHDIVYLDEGDSVVCELTDELRYRILNSNLEVVDRQKTRNNVSLHDVTKNGFEDFMLKEIFEEPVVAQRVFRNFKCNVNVADYRSIYIIACGTSYYAGLLAKYWLESLSRVHTDVEIASEFRYRNPVLSRETLYIFISQSGETIDTLSAMRQVKNMGFKTLAIVNVEGSSIAREADECIHTDAGFEIGVASTKSFVAQTMVMLLLSIQQKSRLNIDGITYTMYSILNDGFVIKALAERIKDKARLLYLGRGGSFPIALEGALKMKELSYVSAEGYPSGEIKHGPIAMIDHQVYSIIIAPDDYYVGKTIVNAREILARNGEVLLITTGKVLANLHDLKKNKLVDHILLKDQWEYSTDPAVDQLLRSWPYVTAIHMLAYYVAKARGLNADQPRNLAKSVTVE